MDWDTEFTFNRDETIVLKRDVLPYFEDIEDYESCSEILNLYKDLTFKKENIINNQDIKFIHQKGLNCGIYFKR